MLAPTGTGHATSAGQRMASPESTWTDTWQHIVVTAQQPIGKWDKTQLAADGESHPALIGKRWCIDSFAACYGRSERISRPGAFLDACSACKSGPDSGKNLSRTLLLALLCAENDNCASEHWQRPLQVMQLLLGSSDIIGCGRGWLGRPIYGVSIALGGFSAENAAIDGGAKGSTGEQNLSDSICGDTRLVLGAISVGVKEQAAPDEVGADRSGIDWSPLRPPH